MDKLDRLSQLTFTTSDEILEAMNLREAINQEQKPINYLLEMEEAQIISVITSLN